MVTKHPAGSAASVGSAGIVDCTVVRCRYPVATYELGNVTLYRCRTARDGMISIADYLSQIYLPDVSHSPGAPHIHNWVSRAHRSLVPRWFRMIWSFKVVIDDMVPRLDGI